MISKHPLKWIIILSTITLLLSLRESFYAVATFWILVATTLFSIGRWCYPGFRRWLRCRAYDISFPTTNSSKNRKYRTVEMGKNTFGVSLEMKSQRCISRIALAFVKANIDGEVDDKIVRFASVECSGSDSTIIHNTNVTIYYPPYVCLGKHEVRDFTITIQADIIWRGRFRLEIREENGNEIRLFRAFEIIDSKQPTSDKASSQP